MGHHGGVSERRRQLDTETVTDSDFSACNKLLERVAGKKLDAEKTFERAAAAGDRRLRDEPNQKLQAEPTMCLMSCDARLKQDSYIVETGQVRSGHVRAHSRTEFRHCTAHPCGQPQ